MLVGPTATGKTAVAQQLAEELNAAVLSADSMQVYRGMDVGTAKPSVAERGAVRYGGLDLINPDADFHVAAYLAHAAEFLEQARQVGQPVIVVGGTGLYVKCLLEGLQPRAAADPAWRAEAETLSLATLQQKLQQLDPARFAALNDSDRQNPRRLIRAMEIARGAQRGHAKVNASEETHPALLQHPGLPAIVGLRMAPALLWPRIQARVQTMYAQGLLEETQRLRQAFPVWSATARQAIGYAEALAALDGGCSIAEAQAQTALRTRQLAKRQMTWFQHQARVAWVDCAAEATPDVVASRIRQLWSEHGPTPLAY